MLELNDLTFRYPGFSVSISARIPAKTRVALLGPSGAGKSTILSGLAGFLKPTSGSIMLNGRDLSDVPAGQRGFSIVFQDQNLFPHLSAAQNVGLAISPALKLNSADWNRVEQALNDVGLTGLGTRKPAQLSGGQQARVTLARLLLQRSEFILLDEPFAALGPGLRREMLGLVAKVCDETQAGLIMVSHDPADAKALCTDTIVVVDGQAREMRPTNDILDNPDAELADYLGVKSN